MGRYTLRTKRGFDFYEVASALQKAIRRGDGKVAGFFGMELCDSGYTKFLWKRLLIISAEDSWGILTTEVEALHRAFTTTHDKTKPDKSPGRLFVAKCIVLLCLAKKSRDADHLCNFYGNILSDEQAQRWIEENLSPEERLEIPSYALDMHTLAGRKRGKSRADFFQGEHAALHPRQVGLFDHLVEGAPHADANQAQDGSPAGGPPRTPRPRGRETYRGIGEDDERERGNR
jgi:replication-associated recombination protein RarA